MPCIKTVKSMFNRLLQNTPHDFVQPSSTSMQYSMQVIFEREVVTTVPEGELKGVLFALHGCLQLTTEWGFQSETCPNCHGPSIQFHRT